MAHGRELSPDTLRFCPLCGGSLALRAVAPDGRAHPVCVGCGFVFYLQPKVVAGTILVSDGRVLLTRRAIEPARGLWTFPGGYVDWGEGVEDAARREALEEVQLAVRLEGLLGLYSYPGAPVVVAVFLAKVPRDGQPVPSPAEVSEVAYFGPQEIPWDALAFPSTRDALRDWVSRRRGVV
ncbi:MAG: NUDIX domain-containing protein [Candidatus Rokuibacteriota bacterium]